MPPRTLTMLIADGAAHRIPAMAMARGAVTHRRGKPGPRVVVVAAAGDEAARNTGMPGTLITAEIIMGIDSFARCFNTNAL